jgi:hypothetical protein
MKIKLIITSLFLALAGLAHAEMSTAESYDISCKSVLCNKMTDDQMGRIDQIVEDQLREKINDLNFSGKVKSVVVLINEKSAEKDILGLSKMNKKEAMDLERTNTFMAFRISPLKDKHSYFAANVYMDRDYLKKENDADAYHVRMNTVGFGKQLRDGWTVEIGVIKEINIKAAASKFNPAPDGLLLTFKKQL